MPQQSRPSLPPVGSPTRPLTMTLSSGDKPQEPKFDPSKPYTVFDPTQPFEIETTPEKPKERNWLSDVVDTLSGMWKTHRSIPSTSPPAPRRPVRHPLDTGKAVDAGARAHRRTCGSGVQARRLSRRACWRPSKRSCRSSARSWSDINARRDAGEISNEEYTGQIAASAWARCAGCHEECDRAAAAAFDAPEPEPRGARSGRVGLSGSSRQFLWTRRPRPAIVRCAVCNISRIDLSGGLALCPQGTGDRAGNDTAGPTLGRSGASGR
jgi:hypothetical protein